MNVRPLEGIKVLEIAAYISGPYAGALLAALGAEVVKVEPLQGDPFRIGEGNRSPYFVQYNAGKKSVAVDLKAPAGVDLIKSLLPHYDVVIENMRPGKVAALGLGLEDCRRMNPGLVYLSISGFGSGGPYRDRPAYDSIGQSLGGFYTLMNDEHDVRLTGTCIADLITAIGATMGVLAGLVRRSRSDGGKGLHIETSVLEGVSMLTIDAMTLAFERRKDPTREARHPQAQNFCLKTASGDSIALHLSSSEKFWRSLLGCVGREDMLAEARFSKYVERVKPENYRSISAVLQSAFLKKTRSEWERILTEADVPFAPALTMSEVAVDPQTKWLNLLETFADGHVIVSPPWLFEGQRPRRSAATPQIGEHTRDVFGAVRSATELDALQAAGTIYSPSAAGPGPRETSHKGVMQCD